MIKNFKKEKVSISQSDLENKNFAEIFNDYKIRRHHLLIVLLFYTRIAFLKKLKLQNEFLKKENELLKKEIKNKINFYLLFKNQDLEIFK